MTAPDEGRFHLDWIARFQWGLLGLGVILWSFQGLRSALAFFFAGLISLSFWHLHRFLVGRMLTPSVRRRWFYAILVVGKLALLTLGARGMMTFFPAETLPFTVGILLFVGGILLEAGRLVLQPERQDD